MIEGREKLRYVESKSTGWQISDLSHMNKMIEHNTSIRSSLKFKAAQLTPMDKIAWEYIKL